MTDAKKKERIKNILSTDGLNDYSDSDLKSLIKHVDTHLYFLGKQYKIQMSWDDALFSWFENVYSMIVREINIPFVEKLFPDKRLTEVYLGLSDTWYYLTLELDKEVDVKIAFRKYINLHSRANTILKFIFYIFYM